MTTLGMDTAAGLAASDQLDSGAQEITALASRLDSALQDFDWYGTDAERTREEWGAQGRPSLDTTAQHLSALAVQIRREAQQQDTASEATGGSATAGSTGTTSAARPHQGGVLGWLEGLGHAVSSRLTATFQGLEHVGQAEVGLLSKVGDVLTGRKDWPLAAIAASALTVVGAEAGTVANAVTGRDLDVLGERQGLAGTPVPVAGPGEQGSLYHPAVTRPTDLSSLMQSVSDGYQAGKEPGSGGDLRVLTVDNGGQKAYVVAIPGTETWNPVPGHTERDLSANVNLVAGNPTAAAESVQRALDAAGVPPGADVLLVGHSQGGIIAGQLAADPAFVAKYGHLDVYTYASPIDHLALQPGVGAFQVAHSNDLVPKLDLGGRDALGLYPNPAVPGVTLASPGGVFDVLKNHNYAIYQSDVARALASNTPEGAQLRAFQATLTPYLVGPGGSVSAVDVPVSRAP